MINDQPKTFCCIAVSVIVDLGTDSGICAVTFLFV